MASHTCSVMRTHNVLMRSSIDVDPFHAADSSVNRRRHDNYWMTRSDAFLATTSTCGQWACEHRFLRIAGTPCSRPNQSSHPTWRATKSTVSTPTERTAGGACSHVINELCVWLTSAIMLHFWGKACMGSNLGRGELMCCLCGLLVSQLKHVWYIWRVPIRQFSGIIRITNVGEHIVFCSHYCIVNSWINFLLQPVRAFVGDFRTRVRYSSSIRQYPTPTRIWNENCALVS